MRRANRASRPLEQPPPGSGPVTPAAVENRLADQLLGKPDKLRLALTCVLAGGHLLIDDRPGVGKTTLARALAQVFALKFARIQFTSDLLPSDILGVSVFDRNHATFSFRPGPIFADLVLADEINRASPRTQSALLEAMAEGQVTVEGETRALDPVFSVIATQNAVDQSGTHALPESQLDRFLMRIDLGYPDARAERALLARARSDAPPIAALADRAHLLAWRRQAAAVKVSTALVDYLLALIAASRASTDFAHGLSPRAGLALQRAAQAWALLAGRDFVLPEDLQAVLPAVVDHRIAAADSAGLAPSARLLAGVALR